MFAIKAKITKCIDDKGYPTFVECEFIDSGGETQLFHEKDLILGVEMLDRNSSYPMDGYVLCEIVEGQPLSGRELVKVTTPLGIESTTGETIFEIFADQLIKLDDGVK